MDGTRATIFKILILILSKFLLISSQNFGYCSDPHCSVPVAEGVTTIRYSSPDRYQLSFQSNQHVEIFVREYGPKSSLLGVKLNGVKGYVPKSLVRETRALRKAEVPASIEFMQSHLATHSYHMPSHLDVSSHIPQGEVFHSVQHPVSDSFNSQPIVQSFQYDSVPLESSRQGEYSQPSHFHASANAHLHNDDGSSSSYSRSINIVQPSPHMESSSHASFVSEIVIARTLTTNVEQTGNFESNPFQSAQVGQVQEPQWHNPASSHFHQTFEAKNFDSQSNKIYHGQVPQTHSQQVESQNQYYFSESNVPQINQERNNKQFDTNSMFPSNHLEGDSNLVSNPNIENQVKYSHSLYSEHPGNVDNNVQGRDFGQFESRPLNQENVQQEIDTTSELLKQYGYNNDGIYTDSSSDLVNQFKASSHNFPNEHYVENTHTIQSKNFYLNSDLSSAQMQNENSMQTPSLTFQTNSNFEKDSESGFLDTTHATDNIHPSDLSTIPDIGGTQMDSINNMQQTPSLTYQMNDNNEKKPEAEFSDSNKAEFTQPGEPEFMKKATLGFGAEKIASKIDEILNSPETEENDNDNEMENDYENEDEHINDSSNKYLDKKSGELHNNIDSEPDATQQFKESNIKASAVEKNVQSTLQPDIQDSLIKDTNTVSLTSSSSNSQLSSNSTQESDLSQINTEIHSENLKKINSEIVENSEKGNPEETGPVPEIASNIAVSNETEDTEKASFNRTDSLSLKSSSIQTDSMSSLSSDDEVNQNVDILSKKTDITFEESKMDGTNNYSTNNFEEPSSLLTVNKSEFSAEQNTNSESLLNVSVIEESTNLAYQTRHLKDIENDNDNSIPVEDIEQTINDTEFDLHLFLENSFHAIRSFVEAILPWIPDPLYTIIIDLEKEGISPKVPVFTVLSAVPCIILIVLLVYIKEKSKERKLIAQLTVLEKKFYTMTAEKNIIEDKLEKLEVELQISKSILEEEKIYSAKLKTEVESLKQQVEVTSLELEKNTDAVETMKAREKQYVELVKDHEKTHLNLLEQKSEVENRLFNEEIITSNLREQLQEKDAEIEKYLLEKSEYSQANEVYEEKVTLLQKNCNQLLQEAEVWNMRVKELKEKLNQETSVKEELENSLKEKTIEIESLTQAVQIFKSFEEIGHGGEKAHKSAEEKLQYLINSSSILMKLEKQEEDNRLLSERLLEEKNKLLDMEVTILDVKSENDKLKLNYNQALQDKTEAQTKLEVLTNYFKDKEIQLQKQLGVQEAVRQRTEEGANSAERKISLMEQENASYKYQVATMKQEMEETERNLKSQIAVQEKKAHENWLAARTAERKLEDMKQEVMQLRQRLTLLEREQENWSNSTRDEILRPVPKRAGNANDESHNTQDVNTSIDIRPNMFPPPPMMLPPDRPLPPLPPLPFLPPFDPPPFRPPPWHISADSLQNSDFRVTPPDFSRGREPTPPRGRNSTMLDEDMGPRQSSPITDLRDSRNSTPPHLLPDFHDVPPHPPRPFYPPMGPRTRFPLPPPSFRRELMQGQRRGDNTDENNPNYRLQHPPPPQDGWHNPNSRV